jgi:hypothetical protein
MACRAEYGIMAYWIHLKTVMIVGSILGLLLLGLVITLRSGVASLRTYQDRERLAVNLSQVLLRVAGYVVGMLAVQRFIGFPLDLGR